MKESHIPQALAELDKKKCRCNLTATLQIVGVITAIGGIGVAAASSGLFPIIFGSVVAVGGLTTTIVSCIKDWSSVEKCFYPISNSDNLNRQIAEKEEKARKKLLPCLETLRQMQNNEITINTNHLETICASVSIFGKGTKINLQVKEALIDIFEANAWLLDNDSFKNAIPSDIKASVIRGTRRQESQLPEISIETNNEIGEEL